MAVPIRLLAGPQNDIQMDLVANTIDINIERNIVVFQLLIIFSSVSLSTPTLQESILIFMVS